LFKGELSLTEILHELPFRRLLELRTARVNRLMDESKEIEKESKKSESESIRNRIISK
jgi:hypothetical protein